MKLKFIGVGGAFAPISIGNSNILLSHNGKNMLIDCGVTAPFILRDEWNIQHSDIDSIWVSHLHSDHIGGLEHYAFLRYFSPVRDQQGNVIKPKLYTIRHLMQELWDNSLKGGLESVEGKITTLTDFFDCKPIEPNDNFVWQGYNFQPVQTIHVMAGYIFRYSYGLLITNPETKKKTFITTDTQFSPYQLHKFYEMSDIIFHDTETLPFKSHVHAHYEDLKTLDAPTRAKIWMYHYAKPIESWEADGFGGFVKKGQEFDI